MTRYLVVAHRTLGGDHLLDHVRGLMAEGDCSFHLLVPATHPTDRAWSDASARAAAAERLEEGLARFREAGADVAGEVGDENPVYAVSTVLRRQTFDRIILSTLPPGPSRWLHLDVPTRLRREAPIPVTHLVAEREGAS